VASNKRIHFKEVESKGHRVVSDSIPVSSMDKRMYMEFWLKNHRRRPYYIDIDRRIILKWISE
jgi:hypothetical protein